MARKIDVREVSADTPGVYTPRVVDLDEEIDEHVRHAVVTGLTATGTVQGDALAIGYGVSVVGTVGLNSGVILPAAAAGDVGRTAVVFNGGANALDVYPESGGTIDGGSANAPLIVAAGGEAILYATAAATWRAVVGA